MEAVGWVELADIGSVGWVELVDIGSLGWELTDVGSVGLRWY